MLQLIASCLLICPGLSADVRAQNTTMVGIDSNYALDMEAHSKVWKDQSETINPYEFFARNGCRHARIRVWVGDEGMNRLNYATQTALSAQKAGLKPYLVIFLSDDWADMVKQPAPKDWKPLTPQQKLEAVSAHAENVVNHMAKNGVEIDMFEIGNEIDFGICGEFEEEWPRRVSLEYMRTQVWPRMIPIIKAAQSGVLKAQPRAKFIIHLAQWNNVDYCIALWQALLAAGIQIDIPGLSYFPSSAKDPSQRSFAYFSQQVGKVATALNKPVLICETGYPALEKFPGQFTEWNLPAQGYPLTNDGQARWLTDLTRLIRQNPGSFLGVFYWSPEWYDGGLWDAFSLFDATGATRRAAHAFKE